MKENNSYKDEQKLKHIVDSIAKNDERIFIDGEISYTALLNYVDSYDELIINALYNNQDTRKRFFKEVSNTSLFLTQAFNLFMNCECLNNSYTSYKNRIGLTVKDFFIKDSKDIVLNFPFKDCYLEGGQSKEEAKREEIFLNESIAYDEIDMLLSEKAFCNFNRYTANEKVEFSGFRRDEFGVIKDNLLIKGNNLLSLHSLKHEFGGKVKLIYIDPPYNTGTDSFNYNDKFNHSTWLVFMKNRLEIAKELLRSDGVIFVQCDDNEQAYLKVLMDEIFGRANFINSISVTMSNMSGPKIQHAYMGKRFPKIKEYILLYVVSKNNYKLNIPRIEKEEWDKEYNSIIPDLTREEYLSFRDYMVNNETSLADKIISKHKLMTLFDYAKREKIIIDDEWKFNNMWRIVSIKPNESLLKLAKRQKVDSFGSELMCIESSRGNTSLIRTNFNTETDTTRIVVLFAEVKSTVFLGDLWADITTTGGIAWEGEVSFPKGKKPEKLLKRIIETATSEGDIVLDFFSGGGTTAAVAHKMNRQYLALEQFDSALTITVERLNNVIKGDSTGVSSVLKWSGGGEFVYFEMAKFNEQCRRNINKANNVGDLKSIFISMKNEYFIHYEINVDKLLEDINDEDSEFYKLNFNEQQTLILETLDLNQMYVPKSECRDKKYGLKNCDIEFTDDFYKGE